MKAITIARPGPAADLRLEEVPSPRIQPGQVRIRVAASGVNRADTLQRRGLYPPPPGESEILGLEVSGTIAEKSPDATKFTVGQRVMALLAGGGYAEEVCVDERLVLPLPDSLTAIEGAGIPEVFLTAHHNLFTLGGARAGSRVLIHAGASGVGTAGIQLLKSAGAKIWVTVGSPEKADACRKLGAEAIEYRQESFAEKIRVETQGAGVDVILDPVGASYLENDLKSLALEGRLVFIGLMSGTKGTLDLAQLLSRRLRIIGSTLRALPNDRKGDVVARFAAEFLRRLEARAITPIVDKVFPATQARDAHEWMEANRNIGKIILRWG